MQVFTIFQNSRKKFQSYFLTFESGSRLELMTALSIPENRNDTIEDEHQGIIHIAFEVESRKVVDEKAQEFSDAGYPILMGPEQQGTDTMNLCWAL